jgi:hypothetical protein
VFVSVNGPGEVQLVEPVNVHFTTCKVVFIATVTVQFVRGIAQSGGNTTTVTRSGGPGIPVVARVQTPERLMLYASYVITVSL